MVDDRAKEDDWKKGRKEGRKINGRNKRERTGREGKVRRRQRGKQPCNHCTAQQQAAPVTMAMISSFFSPF